MSKRIDEIEKTILKMLDLIAQNTNLILLNENDLTKLITLLAKREETKWINLFAQVT